MINSKLKSLNVDRRQVLKTTAIAFASMVEMRPIAAKAGTFSIGVLPHLSARTLAEQYQPLQAYLTDAMKSKVVVSTAVDWRHFYSNVKAGEYDLIITAAHIARLMQLELGLHPIASYHPNIKGVFIAAKSSKITSPVLAKNQRIASANPAALINLQAERWLETTYQMRKDTDYQSVQVRGADSVPISILTGDSTAGIVCLSDLEAMTDAIKKRIQVVSVFTEVPGFVVLTGREIGLEQSSSLTKQLLRFSEATTEGETFESRTGFRIAAAPHDRQMQLMDQRENTDDEDDAIEV
jgi:phosphonate transport system substrate-binding protein